MPRRADTPPDTAAAQLKRVLLALPALADDKSHPLSDVAKRAGTDVATLLRDLRVLVTRETDEPAGFVEPVQLAVDAKSVRLDAPGFFRRPMGLSAVELEALELGLATLRQEAPAEDHKSIDGARERLRGAIARMSRNDAARDPRAAELGDVVRNRPGDRKVIQRCITNHRVAELEYHGARDVEPSTRSVRPFGIVHARGVWYVVAWCLRELGLRVFRLDRIVAARETDEHFDPPADLKLDDVMRGGRVLSSDAVELLRVRYSGRIARWIAERESEARRNEDGSVEGEYYLHSDEWAVGHVLQYGPEAEVLGPERVRERVMEVLRGM